MQLPLRSAARISFLAHLRSATAQQRGKTKRHHDRLAGCRHSVSEVKTCSFAYVSSKKAETRNTWKKQHISPLSFHVPEFVHMYGEKM